MQVTKTHDIGLGWVARMYDTGEMCISHDATSYHLTIPSKSVDTLIDICKDLKKENTQ